MASCRIEWDSRALKELRKLPEESVIRILNAVTELAEKPLSGQPLKGAFQGFRKLRVGEFRVIYSLLKDVSVIQILRVAHRREAYRS